MTSLLTQLDQALHSERHCKRWVVAYSGGLDSTVLLHLLSRLSSRPPLHALHIHHGLQAEADDWLAHCQTCCEGWGVTFHAHRVVVAGTGNIEEAAREARYQVFSEFVAESDLLLQAHHQDDQLETLFLRLFRGTGVDGLKGIPAQRPLGRARLLRPLLDQPRQVLEDYARQYNLPWVDDPSNRETRYDRNYLRHKLLPVIAARWPGYRKPLLRLTALQTSGQASEQPDRCRLTRPNSDYPVLDCAALLALAEPERFHHLRGWLAEQHLVPTLAQLQALQQGLLLGRNDAQPVFELQHWQVRRFQDGLYLLPKRDWDAQAVRPWDGCAPLALPGAGQLEVLQPPITPGLHFEVRFRQGGERCQPVGRAHSQQLKKLLQELDLPPWRRQRLPLIYHQGNLVAVADLWRCQGFDALLGDWQLHWQPLD